MQIMRALCLLLVVVLLFAAAQVVCAPATYTMWLKAHPQAIVADGRSETTISAEVRDSTGQPVPDGTIVNFTTSVGTIEREGRTVAGVARVQLQSSVTIGTAMVSAVASTGNAVATLRVDFLEKGTEMFGESFITVSSKSYLGYDVNSRLVDAAGGVTIAARGLTIKAEEAQIDLNANVLRAKGKIGVENIVISRESKRMEASELYYDFTSMNGVILTPASEGAKRMTFRGRDLFSQVATEDVDQTRSLDYKPISDTSMFIKAPSMIIRPGEEIKFKRAAFYMDGTKMLSVPLYVVGLNGSNTGSGSSQMLTYGTDGLRMDLPCYFSLTPSSTGALRLRRSELGGWGAYTTSPGWQLDMQEDYNFGGTTEGTFALERVTSAHDWGMHWNQRTEFANDSQLYSYVDFPQHSSLFGSTSYSRSFKNYTFSLNGRASKAQGQNGTLATDAYAQTRSKPLFGGALNYSLTSRLSGDTSRQAKFGEGAGLQLYGKPIKLSFLGNLSSSLVAGHNWGSNFGSTITASSGITHGIGHMGSCGLDYMYSWADTSIRSSSQRLSANLNLCSSPKWSLYANATQGITDHSLSAFGSFSYVFAPTWRIGLIGTYQKFRSQNVILDDLGMPITVFSDYTYPDAELSLSKAVGKQEMSIIWSSSQRRFRVEFSALQF